ncbi:MAG TPA: hypothetical protein VGR35_07000 [Tepidisphaeraceae bacterium]|nr:hypothetical protein [Tepidisphaeraceae bacterium]
MNLPNIPSSLAFQFPLRLEYLTYWQAALIFAALAAPIVFLGMRSLNGLGPVRKWVAIGVRLTVLLLFILIIGGVRWTRTNKNLEVIVLRDISESTAQVRQFPGETLQASLDEQLRKLSDPKNGKPRQDRMGVISFHSGALIDEMPKTAKLELQSRAIRSTGNGTDVASAIQLALATFGRDAMHRLVLIWDGNQTTGDLEAAINAAAAANVQIDVMPLEYNVQNEVLFDRLVAPTWKRENEPFTIDVILRSTNPGPVQGKLTVLHQNIAMPIGPGGEGFRTVTLNEGLNVERVRVPALEGGNLIHQFRATFEGEGVTAEIGGGAGGASGAGNSLAAGGGSPGSAGAQTSARSDTLIQNNSAEAFTFVRGKGKVLYVDNVEGGRGELLRKALEQEGITLETVAVDQVPTTSVQLLNYDSIILANVPRGAGGLSEEQQKNIASYVHDQGGGLIMIGGPESFGAGGWQGSKLEEVLPVNMDIPAQRQLPKGALVLIMHSCEMPDGNYWGEQCALKAIETLSERDEIGVLSYAWSGPGGGGSNWDFPLQMKGDGSKVGAAVKNMQLGDMPSFDDSFDVALNGKNGVGGLIRSDARQKHAIVISDGDPAPPAPALVDAYIKAQVSVSTVSVYPHDTSDQGLPPTMRKIAEQLKGRAYGPINNNPNQLPQIFIKEATVVRRTLIYEPGAGEPPIRLTANLSSSEVMKGLEGTSLPPLTGMVLTSRKPNPQIEIPIVAGKNSDPILAHWQTGLGKAAAFTSDAHNRWAASWVGSEMYRKFWAQLVRGVSRPPMSSDFDVQTVQSGNTGKITVEALNKENSFLNFLNIKAQIVGPDGNARDARLVQTGPGNYSAEFDAKEPGNYVVVLQYRGASGEEGVLLSGMAVNSSPELRELKSNRAAIDDIATRTGGRILNPWDVQSEALFTRDGLKVTSSPLPIWDLLIPILLGLILVDVATRRIAWDWLATKKAAAAVANRVRSFTTTRQVETRSTLDALARVRTEGTDRLRTDEATPVKPPAVPATPRPSPSAKFEARGAAVEGDISKVVGGATDKPIPKAPKKTEPKGAPAVSGGMSSLMEAKRRARQQIEQKEKDE